MRTMFDLAGRVALVTGGGHGLGREMCKGLAEFGATIACNDVVKEWAEETCDIARELGQRSIAVQADVANPLAVTQMVEKVVSEFGTVDILCANAGRPSPSMIRIHEMPLEYWDSCMNVDLRGAFLCIRAALPIMLEQKRGSIIVTSSVNALVAGVEGRPMHAMAGYHAAKAGLLGLTREAAIEYAKDGIRVNCILPGGHDTQFGVCSGSGMSRKEYDEFNKYITRFIPMGRLGSPAEIQGLTVYLASDASSYVTGQTFIQDGGFCC